MLSRQTHLILETLRTRRDTKASYHGRDIFTLDRRHSARHCWCQPVPKLFLLVIYYQLNKPMSFIVSLCDVHRIKTGKYIIRVSPRANLFAISPCSRLAVCAELSRLLLARAREGDPPASLMMRFANMYTHIYSKRIASTYVKFGLSNVLFCRYLLKIPIPCVSSVLVKFIYSNIPGSQKPYWFI